jgi:phosphoenolpyruvate phosphomutase
LDRFAQVETSSQNAFQALLSKHKATGKANHIAGVHDCVSARIAERANFAAVWISSFGLSVVSGKCDRNEVPWTEVVNVVEQIRESCSIPIILDGNEGFGDINIAKLFSRRAGARGASCISFEDKIFPKRNSFSQGVELCAIDSFVSKIRGCKEVLDGKLTSIIARTDSFVAGEDMGMTLKRAHAYTEAGADALIIHSKASSADQLTSFMRNWDGSCPIIAIPTSYDSTDPGVFDNWGISCVIWANQLLRASISAMENAAAMLFQHRSSAPLAQQIISIKTALSYADCKLGCETE